MNDSKKNRIAELREKIDAVDAELLSALNRRAGLVIEVGRIKQHYQARILDLERESLLMARLLELNRGPLKDEMVQTLFQSIIETLKQLQSGPTD